MQESFTARRSAQSAARGARGVTAAPAIITLSRRHAALSEAGTVLRPSDTLATCSCELQAVPHAPLRAGEPHSAPQHSAARRLPPEPLAASHRPPRAYPREASCRARRGRDGPKTVSHYGHRLVRARGRAQRCSPCERARQRAADRRPPRESSAVFAASHHTHSQRASRRIPCGSDGPKATRRSCHQLVRARGCAQRCSPCEKASQHATARRAPRQPPEALHRFRP